MAQVDIFGTQYRQLCCSECSIVYYFSEHWCVRAEQTGKEWRCPNEHGQCFGESEYDKIRRDRDRLKQRIAEKNDAISTAWGRVAEEERSKAAVKGHLTRARRRSKVGLCPCCNRTFKQLASHMKTQHPDFESETNVVPIQGAG